MQSSLLTSNLGILLTTFTIVIFLAILTFFLLLCVSPRRSPKCFRCVIKMNRCLSCNFFLRLLIETYLDICLCSLLTILNVRALSQSRPSSKAL